MQIDAKWVVESCSAPGGTLGLPGCLCRHHGAEMGYYHSAKGLWWWCKAVLPQPGCQNDSWPVGWVTDATRQGLGLSVSFQETVSPQCGSCGYQKPVSLINHLDFEISPVG